MSVLMSEDSTHKPRAAWLQRCAYWLTPELADRVIVAICAAAMVALVFGVLG